ncbi:Cysteine and histidine-rich domain-containing 1 protein [Rutstroemia sp. NJR-2017a BVV2]|nr:Cysteine and histidine-rich domain-containing 1 protein [Rutstroemia sp. NJR-2017a BVV2]
MPGLTVSTSPSSGAPTHSSISPHSTSSRSASPVRPPYSPITPTLSAARLAPMQNGENANANANAPAPVQGQFPVMDNFSLNQQPPQRLVQYSHAQDPQVSVPQPKPEQIRLDENPDVLAMRSTISILQLQARKAERDMLTLQRIKERALGDPEGFVRSLKGEDVRSEGVVDEGVESSSDEDEEDDDETRGNGNDAMEDVKLESENEVRVNGQTDFDARREGPPKEKWEKLPTPQNIVRCPPINWAKYGVVGESLDKMHEDQVRRPSEGFPAKINPDGTVTHVYGDGPKREYNLAKPLGVNEVVVKSKKKK